MRRSALGIFVVAVFIAVAMGCGDDPDEENDGNATVNPNQNTTANPSENPTQNNSNQNANLNDPGNSNQSERIGHGDVVNALASDGNYLYTASDDTTVHKVDPGESGADPERVWSYDGHDAPVQALIVDDAGYLYSGDRDGEVHKIDPANEALETHWTFEHPSGGVSALALADNGDLYVGGGWTALRLDPSGDSPEEVWTSPYDENDLSTVYAMAVGADGDLYIGGGNGTDGGGELHRVDPSGDEPQKVWVLDDSVEDWGLYRVRAVAADDDGYVYIGSEEQMEFGAGDDDLRTVHKIDPAGEAPEEVWVFEDRRGTVTSLFLDDDDNIIVGSHGTPSGGGKVFQVDQHESDPPEGWIHTGHSYWVHDVVIGPGGDVYSAGHHGEVHRLSRTNGGSERVWEY